MNYKNKLILATLLISLLSTKSFATVKYDSELVVSGSDVWERVDGVLTTDNNDGTKDNNGNHELDDGEKSVRAALWAEDGATIHNIGTISSHKHKYTTQMVSILGIGAINNALKKEDNLVVLKNGSILYNDGKIKEIKFENLYFAYDDAKSNALKNINLDIKAGEVVAFVGKSGSGKTTIVNLIPRFFEATAGKLTINGIDIKNISLKKYRDLIGIVPQESFLFSGTIAENISFGKENVTIEEIEKAAKMANAYEFIKELQEGFETEVGERGVILSGGQKQRIAIARALIQNPEILILDEATSALDTESERLVQDALDRLMVNRTTFVIAHRLSTIINADKIVVMENGMIKEIGKHQELLDKNGLYKHFYDIQFGKEVKKREEMRV